MADSGKAAIEVLSAMILSVKSYSRYISGYGLAPRLSMLFALISIQPKTRLNLQAFVHSKIFRIRILINVKVFAMSEIPSIWKSQMFGNPIYLEIPKRNTAVVAAFTLYIYFLLTFLLNLISIRSTTVTLPFHLSYECHEKTFNCRS